VDTRDLYRRLRIAANRGYRLRLPRV
jgi:hypothetical protein